ncbi:AAA family ATPase [Paenibacillus methanolicus]|uniref:ATPase family protein associated with various cellular activities (AAA) n=1 Tax=Paenibacillus methanolicus TaxID=582686 RepID=A0A5S5BPR4_9BACL|nr:ATP-binding protein [Paenibacillus methanolicus]TYP68336.1 ATPase family protein associated with various cellular activities (AAA) [Paenibacillus methanolicus]
MPKQAARMASEGARLERMEATVAKEPKEGTESAAGEVDAAVDRTALDMMDTLQATGAARTKHSDELGQMHRDGAERTIDAAGKGAAQDTMGNPLSTLAIRTKYSDELGPMHRDGEERATDAAINWAEQCATGEHGAAETMPTRRDDEHARAGVETIISADEELAERVVSAFESYSDAIMGIRRLLAERYGENFELYADEDGNKEYWEQLKQDLQLRDGEAERIARIYASVETSAFDYREGSWSVYRSLQNNVFAYTAWGVALARVPVMRPHGIGYEDCVFAADETRLLAFLEHCRTRRRELDRSQVTVFTDRPHGTEKKLESITTMVQREEVVMHDDVKKDIYRSIDRFFSEDRSFYETFGVPYKRGILLYGKPGNGKTTLVKSIAGSVQAPVAYWQITEHTCSDTIQEVFEAAASLAPMILVVEDMDAMPERARSYFLNTLDGATSKEGIFLIGTTNYPERIDPALMNRAGRFDRAYEIKLPDAELRDVYMRRKGFGMLAGEEELKELVGMTEGFTFAQLNELYVSAAMVWYEEKAVNLPLLAKRLKGDLHKGRTQEWFQDPGTQRVGFMAI